MLVGAIVVTTLIIIASFLFLFSSQISKLYNKLFFQRIVYRKLYRIALDYDYYLLNNVCLEIENKKIHFNHLLFTNKYIYVIADTYYTYNLQGNFNDDKWLCYNKKGTLKKYVKNPMNLNQTRTRYLAGLLGASTDLFINLVVTNSDVLVDKVEGCDRFDMITNTSNLKSLIKKIEKESNVALINQNELHDLVNKLYKVGVNKK